MNAATEPTYLVRMTSSTAWMRENGRPDDVVWLGITKTGKRSGKTKREQAARFALADAQAHRDRWTADHSNVRSSAGTVVNVEVVPA